MKLKQEMESGEHTNAFLSKGDIRTTLAGTLSGVTFSVKDNIDVAGLVSSYGSPDWLSEHPAALHNAVCVDLALAAGARYVGKVVADEFTYSLEGQNQFFGTPLNPKAPDRIPGGSSSGSAASVATGSCDFSLGTDSGGSIRVPASFCGVWGIRPSLHRVSEAGVLPFMPSVSTVGVIASGLDVLIKAMQAISPAHVEPQQAVQRLVVLEDAMDIADEDVRATGYATLETLSRASRVSLEVLRFSDITNEDLPLEACNLRALRNIQTAEVQSTLGTWIHHHKPQMGYGFSQAYANVVSFDRTSLAQSWELRELLHRKINTFFRPGTLICFPTTPFAAPLKNSLTTLDSVLDFYDRTMAITAFSGVARLPEVSAPLLSVDHLPVGLSFAAGNGQDAFLLSALNQLTAS